MMLLRQIVKAKNSMLKRSLNQAFLIKTTTFSSKKNPFPLLQSYSSHSTQISISIPINTLSIPFRRRKGKKGNKLLPEFLNVVVRNTLQNRYTYRYRGIEKSFFGDCGCITAAASRLSLCLFEEISRNNFSKIQTTFRLSPFWLSFLGYFSRYFRDVSFGFVLSPRSELPQWSLTNEDLGECMGESKKIAQCRNSTTLPKVSCPRTEIGTQKINYQTMKNQY